MPTGLLDGRTFKLVSSTASVVDAEAPSVFHYFERDGVLWGDYTGDTVTTGRFVGTREDDTITVSFVHSLAATGAVVGGTSTSAIERDGDALRLVENFEIDGAAHVSVCVEVV